MFGVYIILIYSLEFPALIKKFKMTLRRLGIYRVRPAGGVDTERHADEQHSVWETLYTEEVPEGD